MSQRLIQLNPSNKIATWSDIKLKREELKRIPVETSMGIFDVDERSFLNITTSIGSFSAISDKQTNLIAWKLNDNSFVNVSLADLEAVRNAVAIRANVIHAHAEIINTGNYLVKDLDNNELWGI